MGAVATSMLFQPPQRPWEKNANFIPIQTKTSKNRGHTINASLVLAEGAKYTVLFSHGNAEDLRQNSAAQIRRAAHYLSGRTRTATCRVYERR